MVESSDEPSLFDRIVLACKWHAAQKPSRADGRRPSLPLTDTSTVRNANSSSNPSAKPSINESRDVSTPTKIADSHVVHDAPATPSCPAPPPDENGHGEESAAIESGEKSNVTIRFFLVFKEILLSSWLNVLLIFVPVGIGIRAAGVNPTIVFAINAIAIVPLAGLLTHATESVASEMGDTIGALMNVTFGNAVELIILFVCWNHYAQPSLTVS